MNGFRLIFWYVSFFISMHYSINLKSQFFLSHFSFDITSLGFFYDYQKIPQEITFSRVSVTHS